MRIYKNRFWPLIPTCVDKKDAGKNPALGSRFVRKWLSNFLSGQPNVIELREIQHFGGTYHGKNCVWRPSCSFASATKVPRYPASAQNFWITDVAHTFVLRQISRLLCHEYWRNEPQQTTSSPAHPLRCAASCLSFFPSVNSASFVGCYRFYAPGINDCAAWTLLASGICSHLFTKCSRMVSHSPLIRARR